MPHEHGVSWHSINSFFNASPQRVWKKQELSNVLEHMRGEWNLAGGLSTKDFIALLTANTKMEEVTLSYSTFVYRRCWWGEPDFYEIASTLTPRAYLSHHTALYANGLADEKPSCVYGNAEQLGDGKSVGTLEQERIDSAFQRPARTTQNVAVHRGREIYLLTGKNTRNLGVVETKSPKGNTPIRITNVERTLIDATVRPLYSGGTDGVLRAFQRAARKVSTDALLTTLDKVDHKYPYHQAIGFYMDRTGMYDQASLHRLKEIGLKFDFYLDYAMNETAYSKEWRIYYPKSLEAHKA